MAVATVEEEVWCTVVLSSVGGRNRRVVVDLLTATIRDVKTAVRCHYWVPRREQHILLPSGMVAQDSMLVADIAEAATGRVQLQWVRANPWCEGCGIQAPEMKLCGRCRRVSYCSAACQRNAWPQHRLGCEDIARVALPTDPA